LFNLFRLATAAVDFSYNRRRRRTLSRGTVTSGPGGNTEFTRTTEKTKRIFRRDASEGPTVARGLRIVFDSFESRVSILSLVATYAYIRHTHTHTCYALTVGGYVRREHRKFSNLSSVGIIARCVIENGPISDIGRISAARDGNAYIAVGRRFPWDEEHRRLGPVNVEEFEAVPYECT